MRKLLFVAALFGLLFLAAACAKTEEMQIGNQTGMANPASVFCEEQGGQLKMVETAAGTRGFCILQDGTECDEWQYYGGECPAIE